MPRKIIVPKKVIEEETVEALQEYTDGVPDIAEALGTPQRMIRALRKQRLAPQKVLGAMALGMAPESIPNSACAARSEVMRVFRARTMGGIKAIDESALALFVAHPRELRKVIAEERAEALKSGSWDRAWALNVIEIAVVSSNRQEVCDAA